MNNYLVDWGIAHLLDTFQGQRIDEIDILKSLSDIEIDILIPSVGDRIRLRKGLASLESKNQESGPSKKFKFDNDPPHNSSEQELDTQPILVGSEPIHIEFIDEILPSPSIPIYVHSVASASTVTNDSNLSLFGSENSSSVETIDLQNLFSQDILAQALLQKAKNKTLTNSDRDRIADIIITSAFNKLKKLDHNQLRVLANKLVDILPNEKSSTYFISPIKKRESRDNKPVRARGKLVEKYRNKLHLLKILNSSSVQEHFEKDDISSDISDEAKNSQIWLKKNTEPQSEVLDHWKKSHSLRKLSKCMSISTYLEEWPILKTQLAPELINYDFESLHVLHNFDIENKFNSIFETIYEKKKNTLNATDNTIYALLNTEITTDSRIAIQLYLMASLIPPKGRTRTPNKAQWKPSISECRESVILHVVIPGDILTAKQKRIDSMYGKGLTVQPYILLVGNNLNNITSTLVVINNIDYKCHSVLDALDFCFKAYQILDAKYPFESQHLWYLFQWELYNYHNKFDPKLPLINEFLK